MKKFLFAMLAVLIPVFAFAQDAGMDWEPILAFLQGLAPWVYYVLVGLGSAVVIGIGIDMIVPDEIDKGFMKKVMAIPVLGSLLAALKRFSPFNVKE